MKKIFILFFLLVSSSSFGSDSNSLEGTYSVERIRFDKEKNWYRISFRNEAGVYKSGKEHVACFSEAMKAKKQVSITANPIGLHILSCKKK